MSMVYEWGSRRFGVDPQLVGETVATLAQENGGVCPPAALVDASRPQDAPTHKLFTWDDDAAAEAWRRQEARNVVRCLRVVSEGSKAKPSAFLHVNIVSGDGPKEGYAPFATVVADDGMRDQALKEALSYLNGFRRRYRHLQELSPVLDAIEQVARVAGEHEAA